MPCQYKSDLTFHGSPFLRNEMGYFFIRTRDNNDQSMTRRRMVFNKHPQVAKFKNRIRKYKKMVINFQRPAKYYIRVGANNTTQIK